MSSDNTAKPHGVRIRRAEAQDAPRMGEMLARAFFDDPVFVWCYPDEHERRQVHSALFFLYAETLVLHGASFIADDFAGAALWSPPGKPMVDEDRFEDFNRRYEEAVAPGRDRALEVHRLVLESHANPDGNFYYLAALGVDEGNKGRGVGSALLAHVLERCDREGSAAYLNATNVQNKRLYERHGFRATAELNPKDGPPLWLMWRDPSGESVSDSQ